MLFLIDIFETRDRREEKREVRNGKLEVGSD
jgi:hypothetical protein